MKTFAKFALVVASVFALAACNKNTGANLDKTALEATIKTAQEILASATTDEYPQSAIDLFTRTLSTVQGSIATADTQAKIDNLNANLLAAIATFEASAYGAIPAEALTFEVKFDDPAATKTTGSNAWDLVAGKGPVELYPDTALPTFVDGKVGKAAHFTKGSHFAIKNFNPAALAGKELSIVCWVKTDETYENNYILSFNRWSSFKFQLQSVSKVFLTANTDAGCIDKDWEIAGVPEGEWHQIGVTLSCNTGKWVFYLDGAPVKTWEGVASGSIKPAAADAPADYLFIGQQCSMEIALLDSWFTPDAKTWSHFKGCIDELRVYNVALTDGQVSRLYNKEK